MLELYHNNISVNAQKVRIVLAEKNLEWTGHHLSFAKGEHLTTEYKALNPRGLVPVLVHDGHAIIESSVICSYLDEVFPDPPLTPKAPIERATMRLWCKLPDDVLHIACGTVSFAISFGEQLKKQAGDQLEERLMKIPDPARRERQRVLIDKGIEAPFFRKCPLLAHS
jgi:glutathione S-transferase